MNPTTFPRMAVVFSLLVVCLLLTQPALGQASSLKGSVTDPVGAVVQNAAITLTSVTGAVRTATSSDAGIYQFSQLPPGMYQLKAETPGFKAVILEKVELLVDTPVTQQIQFTEVGEISQTVTVESSTSKLNTQDGTIGNTFEGLRIRQLPLESRNVAALLSVQPAVTREGYVSGARSDQSNLTLDGIDVNEQQTGEAFTTVLRINPDSVQEFRVTTASPTAAQGRSSAAQVSLITRTGNNEFHGSAYEFHRNTVTTANDFFNNRSGVPRPKLIRNLFGGSIGGPIKRDRAFFFYNYEGRRDAKQSSVLQTVPLASLGRGELVYESTAGGTKTLTTAQLNALFPAVGVNPAAVAVFADAVKRYPANDSGAGDGLNIGGFRFNAPLPVRLNAHTATLNFNLTEDARHTLLVRGNYQHDVTAGTPNFPDTPGTDRWSHPIGYALQHTWTVNNALVNTFRYGLTRLAFSDQGDSAQNSVSFRFVFSPRAFSRTLNRVTPTHNIVDDVSWVRGNHTWQFGANIRTIRNQRTTFARAYDSAIANPSFYQGGGAVLNAPITDIRGAVSVVQNAVSALIGRFSQYSANYNFGADGKLLASGAGVGREFATEEYEFYLQDSWRLQPNFTLTLGLRWGVNTPVYETNGLQVKPSVSLGEYFELRKQGALQGIPYDKPISLDLAGPKNNRPGFYKPDRNNFAPRAAFAWSPSFDNGFLRKIFGGQRQSVIRGGFAMLYDRIGSALTVSFDLNNTLGFSSSQTISANTYNVTTRPAPLFTGFNQDVRALPRITPPSSVTFPLQHRTDGRTRIESTLDDTLKTPVHYSWNLSIGRELARGFAVEASYIGRVARDLLASRDIMSPNNIVDPLSKMDWYTAAGILAELRDKNTPVSAVPNLPFFANLFPDAAKFGAALSDYWGDDAPANLNSTQLLYLFVARGAVGGYNYLDWTSHQDAIDDAGIRPNMFFQPQYGALSVWSTLAASDYHAATLTLRERYKETLTMDINYTFSKSIDNASGLERGTLFGAGLILNPLRPEDNRAVSDFDITHILNSNVLWELPFGRSRAFFNSVHPVANTLIGGWQLGGIFRWNSGLPVSAPFDAAQWATNWNVQSNGVSLRPVKAQPTKLGAHPNLFTDPVYAYQSYRNARAGETGERNTLRNVGFISLDFGLGKTFDLNFINEGHKLQFRWEVFNATNTQRLGGRVTSRTGYGLSIDPNLRLPSPLFGRYSSIQGEPRVMQFALRYDF